MRSHTVIMIVCMVIFGPPIYADEIFFKNGDRLTGKIDRLVDGKLVFKSDVAGEVTVDISSIQTFSSDSPIKVYLKDGTVLDQKVLSAKPDWFAIERGETLQAQEFELATISSINPPAKPEPKWSGSISGGFTFTQGNTKTEAINASVSLSKRTEKDRTQVSADYGKAVQEDPDTGKKQTTTDWWRTKTKYDYFFTKKFYGYLDGRYERDAIALLDRRVIMGGGSGHQWIESEDTNFSTELGIASLYEKFYDQTDSNSELSAQFGYNFDKRLTKSVRLFHNLTYYPSVEKFSDYFLTSTAEIRASFTERMFTNFKVIFDYDATPARGAGNTDLKYIFGVGMSF